jgi:hypothetical protein
MTSSTASPNPYPKTCSALPNNRVQWDAPIKARPSHEVISGPTKARRKFRYRSAITLKRMVVHTIGSTVPSAAYRTTVIICGVFFAAGLTIAAIDPSSTGVGRADGRGYCGTRGLFTAFSAGVIIAQLGGVAALLVFTAVVMIGLGTAHCARCWKRSCRGCRLRARKMLIA